MSLTPRKQRSNIGPSKIPNVKIPPITKEEINNFIRHYECPYCKIKNVKKTVTGDVKKNFKLVCSVCSNTLLERIIETFTI